jgi:hypothetical protein
MYWPWYIDTLCIRSLVCVVVYYGGLYQRLWRSLGWQRRLGGFCRVLSESRLLFLVVVIRMSSLIWMHVQLAPILQNIFQVSIDTGDLTKDWRDANISSIFKKGDTHLPENYRPVSLNSVPCKLLEHIIYGNVDLGAFVVFFQKVVYCS